MSWGAGIAAGVIGGLVGGAGMLGVSIACVKWYRISSVEGKSAFFVAGCTLAGVLGGVLVAIIASRVARGPGQGMSGSIGIGAGAVLALLVLVGGIAYARADREPDLGGQGLVVLWEVRLPQGEASGLGSQGDPQAWPEEELRLQLVSVVRDRPSGSREADFDRGLFRLEAGQWILPARVPLFTSKGRFCVNLTWGGRDDGFWPSLRPVPYPGYFEWSSWERTNKGLDKKTDAEAVMYRYKLVKE